MPVLFIETSEAALPSDHMSASGIRLPSFSTLSSWLTVGT